MTVLVFDSGIGGLTVADEIRRLMPEEALVYIEDTARFPYGDLAPDELISGVVAIMDRAVDRFRPDVVVIACNTASTLVLPALRARFSMPIVGTVPAIKPAAEQSRSRLASVLATPGTVRRDYTRELIATHGQDCRFTLVGSRTLAAFAEAELAGKPVADEAIFAEIRPAFVEENGQRTDTIVLACTHYPWLLQRFRQLAPWPVSWIDSAPAIARRVLSVCPQMRKGGQTSQFLATGMLADERILFAHGFAKSGNFI